MKTTRRLRLPTALLLLPITFGCFTTHTLQEPPDPGSEAFRRMEDRAARGGGLIVMQDTTLRARSMIVRADGVSDGAGAGPIPWSRVSRVEFGDRGRGMRDGLEIGLLVGAAAGLTLGILAGTSPGVDSFGRSRDGWDTGAFGITTVAGTILASLVTVPVGALLGSVITHRIRFEMESGL